jgi:hypothetical protein
VIYAIRAVGTEYVKIGKANSVGTRLKQMETGCPFELHIEAAANWPDAEERRIHRHLEQSYVRGEWYRDGQRLEEVIKLMRAADGLEVWTAICEAKGWLTPLSVAAQSRAERGGQRPYDLKPLSPVEQRRKERQEWWRRKGEHSTSKHAGSA